MIMVKVIDASDLILGRLASSTAKLLMEGEEVTIINAEKSFISGNKASILSKYKHRRERASIVNPVRHGPFFPRRPDDIIKRTVRGMVPHKKYIGRTALKRLRVYVGSPENLAEKAISLEKANKSKLYKPKYMELGELSRLLGAKF